MKACW